MRLTRLVALLLTLAVPCGAYAQRSKQLRPPSRTTPGPQPPPPRPSLSPSPPQMSFEKAFYYFVAIYGQPGDVVDRYGKFFDAGNYERAMADEFERNRYREKILARIADGVRNVDFNDKFTLVAQATLGEYSFGNHSFPFVWNLFPTPLFCIHRPWYPCRREFIDLSAFRVEDAVNGNDFNWSLPMSEADASAFVKSRSAARIGDVDRLIMVRITYSVVNKKGSYAQHYTFSPFIFSVEAYSDESLTRKLGVIPKINSLGASTAEELRLATAAAQTATKEIGKYRYIAAYRNEKF